MLDDVSPKHFFFYKFQFFRSAGNVIQQIKRCRLRLIENIIFDSKCEIEFLHKGLLSNLQYNRYKLSFMVQIWLNFIPMFYTIYHLAMDYFFKYLLFKLAVKIWSNKLLWEKLGLNVFTKSSKFYQTGHTWE